MRTTRSRLADCRALIIGVGGLGCSAARALALAGVGTLDLVDPDVVDVSNLPRQLLYDETDLGRPKVDAAARRLRALAPATRVVTRYARFTGREASWLAAADVILDGTDGIAAKFMVNDAAVGARVALVHAGAVDFRAQLLTVLPGVTACLRCIFEEAPPTEDVPACQDAGVLGPTVALAGSLQAAEALRLLTGVAPHLADRFVSIDLRTGAWRSVPVARRPDCAACDSLANEDVPQRSDAS